MPGWYIHLEAAKVTADRLRAGDVPPELGLPPSEAQRLGDLCHTWRNYLAVGALGPDLFFMLPDFKDPVGSPLLHVVRWVLDTWEAIDEGLLEPIDEWLGPVGANNSDLINTLTGGLSDQLSAAIEEWVASITNAVLGLIVRLRDLFGLLTSGQAQGVAESAFYWSDMLHYRRTYDVPRVLYAHARAAELAATTDAERLDAQTLQVFAVGWMSHCATDVTGHAFTNAKSGGPFRLHWQRHHLVENHFDSEAYRTMRGGQSLYSTIGTSALHVRIAFCERANAPYAGRRDAPMRDYFGTFPPYPAGTTAANIRARHQVFDTDTYPMPTHLVTAMMDTFKEVYADTAPDITPEVLNTTDPAFGDDGRPNEASMGEMWELVFRFLKHMGSSGFGVALPPPPGLFEEHPFPTPPGAGGAAGADEGTVVDDDSDFNLLDLLLALLAWAVYLGQIALWLASLPLAALDPATFPARAAIYYGVVVPSHDLLLASRRILVMAGFITPESEEIDGGLTTLGRSSAYNRHQLAADLADPAGFAASIPGATEPSGRPSRNAEWDADPAYPRDSTRDPADVAERESTGIVRSGPTPAGEMDPYSEWVAPWRYPHTDLEGDTLGWEGDLTHVGPYAQGQRADTLLSGSRTDVGAAQAYEKCASPEETERVSAALLPLDEHLGHPVDYTLYLVSRLTQGDRLPGFNLDSDRGYGWQCWDYDRHADVVDGAGDHLWETHPWGFGGSIATAPTEFVTQQPCVVPAQFDPDWVHTAHSATTDSASAHEFSPLQRRLVHYLEGSDAYEPRCDKAPDVPVTGRDREKAKLPPEGRPRGRG